VSLRTAQPTDTAQRTDTVQLCCAWCGRWADVDEWVSPGSRPTPPNDGVPVSHGICPDCLGRMQRQTRTAPSTRRRAAGRRRSRADANRTAS
jgi:hypothetical protein